MKRILVLEDDLALNAGLCFELDNAGYCSISAYNCAKAMQVLQHDKLDLAILDVNLPDGRGFSVCQEAPWLRPNLPVSFLTANDLVEDELLRRIEVALRRNSEKDLEAEKNFQGFDDGFLRIDLETLEVVCNGEKLSLTPNESNLLRLLLANSGQILTRERMLEQLWGNDGCFINDHTLTVVINRLRTKLEGKDKAYIQTIRGIGYAWNEKQS